MESTSFKIDVRSEKYSVESIDLGSAFQYKISTDCNYIMTLYRDENGNWCANKDVQVMDDSLVDEIGIAIENHDD